MTDSFDPDQNATAVITHRIRDDRRADYEGWLQEIIPVCKAQPGHLGVTVIRPVPNVTGSYTILLRFDTAEHLRSWLASDARRALVERARPLLADDETYRVQSGLDFWFTPPEAKMKIPVRWKQTLVTWSAIYPAVMLVTFATGALFNAMGLALPPAAKSLVVTGIVVVLMVYVVMPNYTRLVHRWLFD